MPWSAILNPMNWIKVLGLITTLYGFVVDAWKWGLAFFAKRAQAKKIKAIEAAEEKLEKSETIEDESARLKAKADAICEMEKSLNPNTDC